METGTKEQPISEAPMYIKRLLENVNYPVKKSDLIKQAEKNKESGTTKSEDENAVLVNILQHLGMLPDREYKSYDDVVNELERR